MTIPDKPQDRLEEIRERISCCFCIPPGSRVIELSWEEFSWMDEEIAWLLEREAELIEEMRTDERDAAEIFSEAVSLNEELLVANARIQQMTDAAEALAAALKEGGYWGLSASLPNKIEQALADWNKGAVPGAEK